jgi:hypothetical protein
MTVAAAVAFEQAGMLVTLSSVIYLARCDEMNEEWPA